MTGLWLVSYLALWALLVATLLIVVGILRGMGLQRQGQPSVSSAPQASLVTLDEDGPTLGSPLPEFEGEAANGFGAVRLLGSTSPRQTLIAFLNPMCESCHALVEPLNELAHGSQNDMRVIAIVKGPLFTVRPFLAVYPFDLPVLIDPDASISNNTFDIHRNPFALLYGERGRLVRKGTIEEGREGLKALLGDPSASPAALMRVTPPVATGGPPTVVRL